MGIARLIAGMAGLTTVMVLAGCGRPPTPDGAPHAPAQVFNDADVAFAQQMIPHHQVAIEMAAMARSNANDPRVKELAAEIEAARQSETAAMTDWLQAWDESAPTMEPGTMPNMPGMPSDRVFLEMMIKHNQGAIELARTEQDKGINQDARKLADSIEDGQTAEIAQMQQIFGTLTG